MRQDCDRSEEQRRVCNDRPSAQDVRQQLRHAIGLSAYGDQEVANHEGGEVPDSGFFWCSHAESASSLPMQKFSGD